MNRQVNYPSGFKCRKWTLVVLISIDLLVLILTTIALVQRNNSDDNINPDNRNTTSKIPTLSQITNAVNTVGDNLAKLNITRINVDLGSIDNNSTRQFLDGILNKARENEGQTKVRIINSMKPKKKFLFFPFIFYYHYHYQVGRSNNCYRNRIHHLFDRFDRRHYGTLLSIIDLCYYNICWPTLYNSGWYLF